LWHRGAVLGLCRREPRLGVGWAAKIVNIYLKTAVYVGGLGRPGLVALIHPPLDGDLLAELRRRFPKLFSGSLAIRRIRDIADYPGYERIIAACRSAAMKLRCSLFEVEQLWGATTLRRRNFAVHRTGDRGVRRTRPRSPVRYYQFGRA